MSTSIVLVGTNKLDSITLGHSSESHSGHITLPISEDSTHLRLPTITGCLYVDIIIKANQNHTVKADCIEKIAEYGYNNYIPTGHQKKFIIQKKTKKTILMKPKDYTKDFIEYSKIKRR